MDTPAPRWRRHRLGRLARATLTILALLLGAAALGLFVRGTPELTLRIPAGWHAVSESPNPNPAAHFGGYTLAGPNGARFELDWASAMIGWGCAEDCGAASELKPLTVTLDGHVVTLDPWAWFPGTGSHALPLHSLMLLQPVEDHLGGRPIFLSVTCHPATAAAADEAICAEIVDSITWSVPLFGHVPSGMAVVPLS